MRNKIKTLFALSVILKLSDEIIEHFLNDGSQTNSSNLSFLFSCIKEKISILYIYILSSERMPPK